MKTTRVFQITALLLVLVASVQVGWWLVDLHHLVGDKVQVERTLYAQQAAAVRELLDAGVSTTRARELFPGLHIPESGAPPAIAPQISAELASERDRRINQY